MTDLDIRGWAARKMVAEDSRWAVDTILSGREVSPLDSFVSLLLGHHFVRISYEGTLVLRATDRAVGVPELAALLDDQFASITARVRHATKLLDDTQKTFGDVIRDFDSIARTHQQEFLGKTHRFLRRLETDLGTFYLNGTVLGATITTAYRLALDGVRAGEQLQEVAEEWGGVLAVLNAAGLDSTSQAATLDLTSVACIRDRDVRSDRYLARRYEPGFPSGLKLLLLTVETDINVLLKFVPATAVGHEEAVFRLKVITAYHAVSTLRHVRQRYADLRSPGMHGLTDFLGSDAATWLLSRAGKALRNRSMHYEIRQQGLALDLGSPMFGIVQAVTGRRHEEVVTEIDALLSQLAELFGRWSGG